MVYKAGITKSLMAITLGGLFYSGCDAELGSEHVHRLSSHPSIGIYEPYDLGKDCAKAAIAAGLFGLVINALRRDE